MPWLIAVVAAIALLGVAAFALAVDDEPESPSPAAKRAPSPQPQGPQAGATPDETARKLSEWLRANARADG
jgi:hypothetical protein